MPQIRNYGNPIAAGSVGPRKTPSAPIGSTAIAPIQVRRLVRNGKSPQVELVNRTHEAANYAALHRSKQVFHALGYDGANAPNAANAIYRFAFHTGPYTHALLARGLVYPPISSATQAKCTINIYSDTAMTTLVASADFYYGPKPAGVSFGWRLSRIIDQWLDGVSPDTDYYGSVVSSGGGMVGGLAVFDMQSLTENYSGYLAQNLTMHSPVLSNDRSDVSTMISALWKKGGAQVLNWTTVGSTVAVNPATILSGNYYNSTTSTTLTNLIDRTSTTISASTPGYTLQMTNKDRVAGGGNVPCKMAVWGVASSPGDGQVVLKNSSGTTIATVGTGFTTTPGWKSVAFNMPAALDKYDLQYKATSGTFYVGAVSIYELE